MRKIVFYGAISLDGYLADEHDNLQWLFDTDLAGVSTYEAFDEEVDTVVMGRITYEETKKILDAAPFYQGKEKIIFSRTQTGTITEGKYVAGDVVKILKDLQAQEGKMIWIVGGGGLLTPLLEADLVDEFWIQIAPVLLGKGKRLFEEGNYARRLELIATTPMGELTELHLRRTPTPKTENIEGKSGGNLSMNKR